ncbi:deleted in malignant brain tumors 1 protein-like [Pecten maximus]|uniref:deleted in malignant brain tumors 1 protein-like n=1 Tax=Pecten maximus TaxID=6579 RepID=UPI001457EB6B|nr:deleted in malignant brain tumors 1 protein-like [Pecten maximus]
MNGRSPKEGRVEIYHDGKWGTICDDNINEDEAQAVCEALGFRYGIPVGKAFFERGTGPIFVDNLHCSASGSGIHPLQLGERVCYFNDWSVSNCDHGEDVGVICETGESLENRCHQSWTKYQTHCYKLFSDPKTWLEAQDECRNHGSSLVTIETEAENNWLKNNQFVEDHPFIGAYTDDTRTVWRWVSDDSIVRYSDWLPGQPNNLDDNQNCVQFLGSKWNDRDCTSYISKFICEKTAIKARLVNGSTPDEGRVEIYHGGHWGTICADNFYEDEAQTVCNALGYSSGIPTGEAHFGKGTGPVFLDDLKCFVSNSGENVLELGNLTECDFNGWGVSNCNHGDAGVICTDEHAHVRLVDGATPTTGRVEIYHDGQWGTICDDNFHVNEARAVCEALGYVNGAPFKKNHFGTGTEPIFVDDLNCSQSDSGIHSLQLGHTLCFFKGWNVSDCDHGDAGVLCSGEHGRVRLVNGITPNEGRVEIYHDEEWGTICDNNFDEAEAHAVCEALGYRYGTPFGKAHFGRGRGRIFVDDLECSEPDNVAHLLQLGQTVCSFKGWDVSDCIHREDAGVKCDHARVRLVDGNTQQEGRVEIYHEGQWGTICDDNFRKDEAEAVCDELRYR